MLRRVTIIAAGVALAATSAVGLAQDPKADPNELVCKRQKRTDTRFSKRICHTRAQWTAMSETSKRNYAEMRDRPVIDITRPN